MKSNNQMLGAGFWFLVSGLQGTGYRKQVAGHSKFFLKSELFRYIIILLLMTSCGTTQVVVPNYAQAEIYKNRKYIGKGSAIIQKRGGSQRSNFSARHKGREVGSVVISRSFDLWSLYFTIGTYGIGYFFTWTYPETIIIPTENRQEEPAKSPWD